MFSVRLITADSYQAQPLPQLDPTYSEFRGSEIKHVPVIRIFGTTSTGEKTCLHIHGVFPYLFVPYTGEEDPQILAYRLAASLDTAINVSLGSATSNTQHVYNIQRVSGTPFYGYHRKEHQFLKVYFYSPAMIKRAADLLQNGSVLNQSLQPHESHINYILQFMMDYNIYGMSLINLRGVKHRRVTQTLADLASSGNSVSSSQNSEIVYLPSEIERQSTCEIEIDALASDILNKMEIDKDLELNPGLAAIWDEERARRARAGLPTDDSQLVNPKSPPRPTFRPTDNDLYQEQRLARRLLMISQCDESTLSTTTNQSVAYAAEVRDGENLLNASHVGEPIVQTSERIPMVGRDDFSMDMSFLDSPSTSQYLAQECSILEADDMPLVDILAELARDNNTDDCAVDTDSVLGSQISILLNDDKSDEEEEDASDLNLTCFQLDSLSSLEMVVKAAINPKSDEIQKTTKASPFISPYEISSCSSSRSNHEDRTSTARNSRLPQYDGAGDVSPNLLNSENEDSRDSTKNAKEFSNPSEYNNANDRKVTDPRKQENNDKNRRISRNTSNASLKSVASDPTINYDITKSNDESSSHDSTALTLGIPNAESDLGNYGANGYEVFDRLLEISTNFSPDLDDIHSSIDIDIMLSSSDTEKVVETIVEEIDTNVDSNETIPIETVLNGDPCFTESAELDKSDLTELRDQYVSLLDRDLLPVVHNDRRIESEIIDSRSNDTMESRTIDKTRDIVVNSQSPHSSIASHDSSSSSENVTPNIQEPENRGTSRRKFGNQIVPGGTEICKDIVRTTSDNSDYNCNVVATWAELQNLEIIEKSAGNVGRTKYGNERCRPCPRSMKKRGFLRKSPEVVVPSQVLRDNTDKVTFRVSNSCPVTPCKVQRDESDNSSDKTMTLSPSSSLTVENIEDRLSWRPLSYPERSSRLSHEDSESYFHSVRTAASLDAFHRSIIGSESLNIDERCAKPETKYLAYTDDDCDATLKNRMENIGEINVNDEEIFHPTSHYSSVKSHKDLKIDNQHRHCVVTRRNKILQMNVFPSDELWVIRKRKRGKRGRDPDHLCRVRSNLCTKNSCKLPVVRLRKIGENSLEIVDTTNVQASTSVSLEAVVENTEILENPASLESTIEAPVENLKSQQGESTYTKVKKTRRKREVSPIIVDEPRDNGAEINETKISDNEGEGKNSMSTDATKSEKPNGLFCNDDKIPRHAYTTRRRSSCPNFEKRRVRTSRKSTNTDSPIIEADKEHKKERKTRRARTRYKEIGSLPGIPGIPKCELPRVRRRSRKTVSCCSTINRSRSTSEEISKPHKNLSSELFPNWVMKRDLPKNPPNGLVKVPNGTICDYHEDEISPIKIHARTPKTPSPLITPIIPKRNSSSREHTKNRASKCIDFSPEKFETSMAQNDDNDIHVSTKQEKLPEYVALSLMVREAKSSSTRAALKLLLKKRLTDKINSAATNKNASEEKWQICPIKTSDQKIVTTVAKENNIAPTVIHDRDKNTRKKRKRRKRSLSKKNKDNSKSGDNIDEASFETVSDITETTNDQNCDTNDIIPEKNSDKIVPFPEDNCNRIDVSKNDCSARVAVDDKKIQVNSTTIDGSSDSITVETLDVATEICSPSDFDDSTLSVEFCNSVDDDNADIFVPETADDSSIVAATSAEELSNEIKAYDTERYENAVKEANFFAGKNYTIDAVSDEIPTCLFEEDSNSTEKGIPKKCNDDNTDNTNDSGSIGDTQSEMSFDPRDLDVFDVESLTPSSSINEESIDTNDASSELSEHDDLNVINVKRNEIVGTMNNHEEDENLQETSFEEESPSFEALSPVPRIASSMSSLEEEFGINTRVRATKNRRTTDCSCEHKSASSTPKKNSSSTFESSLVTPTKNHTIIFHSPTFTPRKNFSITINSPTLTPIKKFPMTIAKTSSRVNEKFLMPIDNASFAIVDSDKSRNTKIDEVDEESAKLDSEIKDLVAQVVTQFEDDHEVADVTENIAKPVSINDIEIQLQSSAEMEIVTRSGCENSTSSKEENKEFSANTSENNDTSVTPTSPKSVEKEKELAEKSPIVIESQNIVEEDKTLLVTVEKASDMQISAAKEEELSSSACTEIISPKIVDEGETLSVSHERELDLTMSVENSNELSGSSETEMKSSMIIERNESVSEDIADKSELQVPCEIEKEISATTEVELVSLDTAGNENFVEGSEKLLKLQMSWEKDFSSNSQQNMDSSIIIETADKVLEICEKESKDHKNEKISKSGVKATDPSMSPEEKNDLPSNTREEIESSGFIEKLLDNSDKELKSQMSSEEKKDCPPNTRKSIESPAIVEKPEKLFGNNEKQSEPQMPSKEKRDFPSSPQKKIESPATVDKPEKLLENNEKQSAPQMPSESKKDFPSSPRKEIESSATVETCNNFLENSGSEWEVPISLEEKKDLPSNTQQKIDSQATVEAPVKLLENNKKEWEFPISFKEKKDFSSNSQKNVKSRADSETSPEFLENSNKESELHISSQEKKYFPSDTQQKIESPAAPETTDKPLLNNENEKDILSNTRKKIESSVTQNTPVKLSQNPDNEFKLRIHRKDEKELLTEKEIESYEGILNSTDKSEIPLSELKKIILLWTRAKKKSSTTIGKNLSGITKTQNSLVAEDEKIKAIFESPTKSPVTSDSKEDLPSQTTTQEEPKMESRKKTSEIMPENKNGEIPNEQVEKSTIEIKAKEDAPKRLRNNKTILKSNNRRTKNGKSDSTTIYQDHEKIEENVLLDIKKNGFVVSSTEISQRLSIKSPHSSASRDTESSTSEIPDIVDTKKQVECRPVSIKLVNIDLSKICQLTPKSDDAIKNGEESSQLVIEEDSDEETMFDKVTTKPEALKNSAENTENKSSFDDSKPQDIEETSEKSPMSRNKKVRRNFKKRYVKDSRTPERRSVRICAEMTLKLSRKESLSNCSTLIDSTTDMEKQKSTNADVKITVSCESSSSNPHNEEETSGKTEVSTTKASSNDPETNMPEVEMPKVKSCDENSEKSDENSTSPESELPDSVEKLLKTNISQELVLSEQQIADENSAPSSMRAKKRCRTVKNPQTNPQEVQSTKIIIDENTEPILENPKRNERTRSIDKATIDSQSSDIERKIADASIDKQNLMVKKGRSVSDRFCKIRNIPSTIETTKISQESKSSMDQNTRENAYREMTSPRILSLRTPKIITEESDTLVVGEKIDDSTEKPSLPEESAHEITGKSSSGKIAMRQNIEIEKIERIPIVQKRKGRFGKSPDKSLSTISSERKLSLEKNIDVTTPISEECEVSTKFTEDNEETKSCVVHRRRGRSGNSSEMSATLEKYEAEKMILGVTDKCSQPLEPSSEKCQSKAAVVVKRRGRSGNDRDTKEQQVPRDSDSSSRAITNGIIESKTPDVVKRRGRSGKNLDDNIDKVSSEDTPQDTIKETYSQEPKLMEKITEESIVEPKRRGRSAGSSETNTQKLQPEEDIRHNVQKKSSECELVQLKNLEDNIDPKKSIDSDERTEIGSSTQFSSLNSQNCEVSMQQYSQTEIRLNCSPKRKRKKPRRSRFRRRKRPNKFPQSTNENISRTAEKSWQTDNTRNLDDSVEPKYFSSSARRKRYGRMQGATSEDPSTSSISRTEQKEPTTEENSSGMSKTRDDGTKIIDKFFNISSTNHRASTSPKKRVRLNRNRIERSSTNCETLSEDSSTSSDESVILSVPRKKVRFDENSIRKTWKHRRSIVSSSEDEIEETFRRNFESKSIKFTAANEEKSHSDSEAQSLVLKKPVNPIEDDESTLEDNNLTETIEQTLNSNSFVFIDFSSLRKMTTRNGESHRDSIQDILNKFTSFLGNNKESRINDKLLITRIKLRDWKFITSKLRLEFSTNIRTPSMDNGKRLWHSNAEVTAYVQLQEPKIVLKRLSRHFFQSHSTIPRNERKIISEDFRVPAYDGAADLTSSDSDDKEDPDVTIVRDEKRVCVYQSARKCPERVVANDDPNNEEGDNCVTTPRKRKLDVTDNTDTCNSSRKRRTIATASNPLTKTPSRTSMLKSPGRNPGNYSPLNIIVTSPKVRKETTESRVSIRSDNHDDKSRASASLSRHRDATPRREKSRLHDNMLRGRCDNVNRELGDKHATVATMGSKGSGELDGIQSNGQTERSTVNEIENATEIQSATMTIRDGINVRKKLVFTQMAEKKVIADINETEDLSDSPITESNVETLALQIDVEDSERHDDNAELDETIEADTRATTFGIEARSFGDHEDPLSEKPREIPTDDESNDEDNPCNVTFTQYIDSQLNQNDSLALNLRETSTESTEKITIMPKFKPPDRCRVLETMETYGIPKHRNQEAFFSDPLDAPKQKELANKMLKVSSNSIHDLPAFVSSVEGLTGLVRWRRMRVNEFRPSLARIKDRGLRLALADNERIVIAPLMKPPTRREAKKWLRAREYLKQKCVKEEGEKEAKKKIDDETRNVIQERENEISSNASDDSVVEPSPEKTIFHHDVVKSINATLQMRLEKNRLLKRTEYSAIGKFVKGRMLDSSDSGEKITVHHDSAEIDPSLMSVLEKSKLFREQEPSRHLGVSCGQIEFLSDSTRSNVANENLQNAKALTTYQYLTIMCLEVHVATRGDLLPDAQHDEISAIFYSVQSDVPPTSSVKPLEHGVIVLADTEKSKTKMHYSYASNVPWTIMFANNEENLMNSLVKLVTRTDPEILIGWELETLSWGYVFQRATRLGMNLSKRISRIPATQCKWEAQAPDIETLAEVKLPGRIVLDIWRLMRHEAALLSYTFESVLHHVLNERISCPSFKVLTEWWNLEKIRPSRWRVVEHYSFRVLGVFRILDQLDIIGRTSELARLFGIQFYEVFSRGSQFRVESVMLRLAKPLNYIPVSPSPQQRASMRAMEALPLIMEPESMLYTDPLIVLDFQSLYPSIIIAHNICFSTCLGRIEHVGQPQPFEFGAYTLRVPKRTVQKLQGKVNYAPCGVAYVKSDVRLGILPRMLTEILETRFMVKKAMKDHDKNDKTLQRALHSRQMGLKFLANVTYGYTAANFSGRMPCIEVGDSVISKSKETLERAIKLVESTPKWGARVVYGDTDSLFILVSGKSKADAFVIGNEIADAVTASNPPPIKLKFEKVLYPAILQTKKRYCGYMYETPEQKDPTYLAKGIETVRRDGCPAISKILEKTLRILFETKDVTLVKRYVTRQLDKVLRGKVSIQDLTFAKEFRGLKGYKAKACVPALELTRRLMRKDPRAVPRSSERVRYIIVAGAPNQALIHCVRTPWELINDPGLRPNGVYYVTRVIIPPLNRCLNLMGVDVNAWYREMPHRQILDNPVGQPGDKQKLTIFQYFGTIVCVSCGQPSNKGICTDCLTNPADTLVVMYEKLRWLDRTNSNVTAICQSCVGQADIADCSSLDCPVLYRRARAQRKLTQAIQLRDIIECGNNLEF